MPITGFADEVGPQLTTQIAVFKRLNLDGLDIRSIDGVNVLNLSDAQLDDLETQSKAAHLPIQCVCSPINKVALTPENREKELQKTQRAIEIAQRLGVKRIRIFTPEVPQGEDDAMWPEVKAWMAEQIALAEKAQVMLIHENDARFYGAYPKNAERLLAEFGSPYFKAAFDFANTVLIGYRAMRDWFPWILPHLDTLHIKDAIEGEGKVVPAGEGEGQVLETLKYLVGEGWSGPLTLEPHLQAAGPLGGFSGEQLFEVATNALRKVLAQV
jgi:sugar phosphate isomerase/epimerase